MNGPQNVSVIGTGGLSMSVVRTVGILFQTTAGVSGANNLTFNGTCRINTGGSFARRTYLRKQFAVELQLGRKLWARGGMERDQRRRIPE